MITRDLIVRSLIEPESVAALGEMEWDLLVRQGRRASLLAKLAYLLTAKGLLARVPEKPRQHLESAYKMAQQQALASRWEVDCICQALAALDIPLVLLKGAAYLEADLPLAQGRTFSDIDILVQKRDISRVESQLMIHGWQSSHHDAYDQRYYRQWMHEIPPLRHLRRGTHIDVHHAILPETARIKVNTPALFERLVPLALKSPQLRVLSPCDMLLHSATHLFHEGELDKGLRDLFDLDGLFRHFSASPGFLEGLTPRARQLGLTRPLFYATHFSTGLLATPLPAGFVEETRIGAPPRGIELLTDYCYGRALRPVHHSCTVAGTGLARAALYLRSHWIRMPFPLLTRHILHKTFGGKAGESSATV